MTTITMQNDSCIVILLLGCVLLDLCLFEFILGHLTGLLMLAKWILWIRQEKLHFMVLLIMLAHYK